MDGASVVDQLDVVREVHVLVGQHEKERRRIDRPVVRAVGDLAGACHLAATILVQDLARLFVALLVVLTALVARQEEQESRAPDASERARL